MAGHKRWWILIGVALVAVAVLGGLATTFETSRAKERPCGTPLRIDQREAFRLLERAAAVRDVAAGGLTDVDEAERAARDLEAQAAAAADRCKDRQRLALVGIGGGGAGAAAIVAVSTYQLGRRAGRRDAGVGRRERGAG